MRYVCPLVIITSICGLCAGCGSVEIQQLSAKVAELEEKTEKLREENAQLKTELAVQAKQLEQYQAIKQGYEAARARFASSLSQLAPMLGAAGSPLPPFEGLVDSSWVGKFAPSAEMKSGVQELQNQLKGLLGNEAAKPSP